MSRVPQGRDRGFNQMNVRRWMREHGSACGDFRQLADQALAAFAMADLLAHLEPGDHWIWDVAIEVTGSARQIEWRHV